MAWTRRVWVVLLCHRPAGEMCAIETGSPSAPLIIITAHCSEPPLLLAIPAPHAAMQQPQPLLEPLVELMYGTPCAIAKAPRARGSCVFCVCGVWCVWCVYDVVLVVCRRTLSFIVHRQHAAVVVIVVVVIVASKTTF